jgi:hypothetical protein
VGAGIVRFQAEGPLVGYDRLSEFPLTVQRPGQVAVKRGLMLVAANRPFDVLDGPLIVASLVRQDSEEMKCVGLPRVRLT